MAEKAKVYGLILSQKSEQIKVKPAQAAFNVFGNDSDEDEKPRLPVSIFGQNTGSSKLKRQVQVDIDKALLEDPNVYEYDAVYDEMQASKPKVGAKDKDKNSIDKKPKYIMGLLKAAEHKKKEEEKRKERKVQKEREAEGDMFADKEKFVTSAYKQKMLEMQEEEEKEKRTAAFEEMTDVTKQKDMSGFYRYLYRETTGDQLKPEESKDQKQTEAGNSEVKVEPEDSLSQGPQPSLGTPSSSPESVPSGSDSEVEAAVSSKNNGGLFKSNRLTSGSNYRKRKADSSDSEEGREKAKGRKSSHIQKRRSLSRSKSRSPQRSKSGRNYSRKDSNTAQVSKSRRSKSRSPSPHIDRKRRRDKSRSRERSKKDHSSRESGRKNKHKRSREKARRSRSASRDKTRRSRSASRDKTRRSRSASREKSRRSRSASREKSRRSRSASREKSRRSRSASKEKVRKSRSSSREKSRRSRSRDRSKKGHSSRSNIEKGRQSKPDFVDQRRKHSPSSGDDNGKEQLRHKSTEEMKNPQRSDKTEIKEKDKNVDKTQTEPAGLTASQASGKEDAVTAEKDATGTSGSSEKPAGKPLVDPAKRVYPHHNSAQDIEEARKRYLQRKAAKTGEA